MKFKPEAEPRLAKLSDEDLIQHLVKARDAGDSDQFKLCLDLLLWRRYDSVRARVLVKVPRDDAEDVAMNAMTSAIRSYNFRGRSVGEFVSWLNTIVKRRIADYHKKKEKEPEMVSTSGGDGDGDHHAPELAGDEDMVDLAPEQLLESALSELSEVHRGVVRLRIAGYPSKEVVEIVNRSPKLGSEPMTVANVDQIFSRFRKQLKRMVDEDGET